ncbi:inactive receptor kinase [Tripterygium wilfordii]|uniref:Inactive receptor kinase n=1 Tax=Tripterygium wilfordii TaxID=458696 RepID=A0A7J7DM29_TRIWF|nr:inactive receptor kinase [Tripterygium wilfordii]
MTVTPTPTLFFFFFLFLFFSVSFASDSELHALRQFMRGIDLDPLNKVLGSWTNSAVCQGFYGVTCDSQSGSVIGISLEGIDLSGDLKFSTLLGLKSLQNLSLARNNLTGRLVPTLGSMSSLQRIDLSDNEFYGPIPEKISSLWNLNYLNLSKNGFSGWFPDGFGNLQQLRVLDLHSNQFQGDIGEVFAELRNVEHVDLSYNQFYGGLGVEAEKVSSLANTVQFVNLSHNKLKGGFLKSEVINLFRNLKVLDLGDNQIGGELPSFASLTNLRVLKLANNQFYGPVPEELLESSTQLQELDLSVNGFNGSIPGVNSTTLNFLNLSSNGLSGSLPTVLKSCLEVDLSRNMFSDDISVVLNWERNLEVLDLSSNRLSGNFPDMSLQFEGLNVLNLRNNSLVGALPSQLRTSAKLSVVDLSLNNLSGSIPGSLFSSMIIYLNLSGNHFTGPIPLQGSHATTLLLKLLNLANNNLSGQLPSELSKLGYLELLDLSGNQFKGEIPAKLPSHLRKFNVSNNELSGSVPEDLRRFPESSFHPGNPSLNYPGGRDSTNTSSDDIPMREKHHNKSGNIRVAIIVASVGAAMMIVFVLLAYHRAQITEFHGRSVFGGQTGTEAKVGRFSRPTSKSFSNDHLLTSNSRSLSGQAEFSPEIVGTVLPGGGAGAGSLNPGVLDSHPITSDKKSSPSSPSSSSPHLIEPSDQPAMLDVYSPDRLAGELFFVNASLAFTAEELSRAPAEVLGRSNHGTLYKATLDGGHMLTVKWLRVGLVKNKKEFAKEVKKIGSARHPNIVPLRAYYWGPKEQERLLLSDYIEGDSLTLHLYESTPRRHPRLSFSQRVKVAVDVARCLLYLHDRGLPHGNLKPTNILLALPDYSAHLTDYCLHRLMTPAGIAEQILNLGALGYRAPELATASKPFPSSKADVYAFGVIMMELLTRRSAGDIISGQSGTVDLTDWVWLCNQEGRGMDCIDRDIAGGEEHLKPMDDLLAISLRCILPVNERPNMGEVFKDLCSISV